LETASSARSLASAGRAWSSRETDERSDAKFASDVRAVFQMYSGGDGMEHLKFVHLCRDCGLEARGLTRDDFDDAFHAGRKPGETLLTYTDYLLSLDHLGPCHAAPHHVAA
jgi:hypothetical protein